MKRLALRALLAGLALMTVWQFDLVRPHEAQATKPSQFVPRGDMFYNFYVDSTPIGGVPAQMYISPRPVPPVVGHTYITYQPLMPHEFMYRHRRTYWSHPWQGGWTRTRVRYW